MEKNAGEMLVLNEVQYQNIVEQNEVGIFLLKNDIIEYSNPAFEKVLESSIEKIKGTTITSWVGGDDLQLLEDGLAKMFNGEEERFSADLILKTISKEEKYFSLHLKVLSREKDNISISGASRIATKRVLKSKELFTTKLMFDAIYDSTVEGIVVYNYHKEQMVSANERALQLLKYPDETTLLKITRLELIPQYSDFFPGIDSHELTKDHGRRVKNGEAFKTPGVFRCRDGKDIIVFANVVPTSREYGEAFIIFHDETEKILARKAKEDLEKKYRYIFDNSHEAIIFREIKTQKLILCNNNTLKIFGFDSQEEFAEKPFFDHFSEPMIEKMPKKEFLVKKLNEAISEGRSEINTWMTRKSGEKIRISAVIVGEVSNPENPKVIAFVRDVTEFYSAQKAIKEKNKELKKYIDSNLQLENFAYFASHDLQTPLRSIISFTQLLQKRLGSRLDASESEYMDFVISSSKNMRNLVNDLLSYSRVNTTKINLMESDIKALLIDLRLELVSTIEKEKSEIIIGNLPEKIIADPMKMRQVFQNLITNALKFAKDGLVSKIKIGCKEQANYWLFFVKDNGIGIAPEFQDKIFLLFKRLHGNTDYEGTGIGLAMVKKIIEQHNGEIWLDSEEGEGATFWFTIKK